MKTLYVECHMGAAGDMLFAALLELHPDPAGFVARMNALGLPGVHIAVMPAVKCGIIGTHVAVHVHGQEEESHDHGHAHDAHSHDHGHAHNDHSHGQAQEHAEHHHGSMGEIAHMVEHMDIPTKVKQDVMGVYQLIAQAESKAHGKPVEQVHFHEVGTLDAVADITGVCWLLHTLAIEQVLCSPIHVGSGQVHCAHGILPVPAPATAHILQGVPTYGGDVRGELCTPTGAALLKYFANGFGAMPPLVVEQIGYGMGKKDFAAANCVRVMLGQTGMTKEQDMVLELCANLDDMTGEAIAFAMEMLFAAGAVEVFTTPICMKKGRPGQLLTCLCKLQDKEKVVAAFFKHTTTLGIRQTECLRHILNRTAYKKETALGTVWVKRSVGYGVTREKIEFADKACLAKTHGVSIMEVEEKLR